MPLHRPPLGRWAGGRRAARSGLLASKRGRGRERRRRAAPAARGGRYAALGGAWRLGPWRLKPCPRPCRPPQIKAPGYADVIGNVLVDGE